MERQQPKLILPMQKFQCDHYPDEHGHPTGKALEKVDQYPWKLCSAVVQGIQDLKSACVHGHLHCSAHQQ